MQLLVPSTHIPVVDTHAACYLPVNRFVVMQSHDFPVGHDVHGAAAAAAAALNMATRSAVVCSKIALIGLIEINASISASCMRVIRYSVMHNIAIYS